MKSVLNKVFLGESQAQAVYDVLLDWNMTEKLEALCCDTTASNTGRFNGTMYKSVVWCR